MKRGKITLEFDLDENMGVDPQTVLNNVVLLDDDIVDGFCLTTIIGGFNNTSDFFLSNGQIIKKEFVKNE